MVYQLVNYIRFVYNLSGVIYGTYNIIKAKTNNEHIR